MSLVLLDLTSSMQLKISQAMSTITADLDCFNLCLCQSEVTSSITKGKHTDLKSPAWSARPYAGGSQIPVATLLMSCWIVLKLRCQKCRTILQHMIHKCEPKKTLLSRKEFTLSYRTENKPSRVTAPCTVWQGMKPWMQQPLNYSSPSQLLELKSWMWNSMVTRFHSTLTEILELYVLT